MIHDDAVVLGLTGAFGSGCTTLSSALGAQREFATLKVSDLIMAEWQDREQARDNPRRNPDRGELQDLGDARRRFHDSAAFWAERAVEVLDRQPTEHQRVVFDGLRNPDEIRFLRERFKNFLVVAVDAPWDERWARLEHQAAWIHKRRAEFDRVSSRDIDSPIKWGQKVQACVDEADYIITNDDRRAEAAAQAHLLGEADRLLALVAGEEATVNARPREDETFMHMAQAGASRSACLKRQVGALIVRPGKDPSETFDGSGDRVSGKIVGIGYNENPDHMLPCFQEFKTCYRDIWREERLKELALTHCPACGSRLAEQEYPPICTNPSCEQGTSLLNVIFPERAMSHCTAIHAEVRAILAASSADLDGTTMYTTTFPCFLCAQQIINAGVSRVVYVEAYPDKAAVEVLERGGVTTKRFHGVRSGAYDRLFRTWRETAERVLFTERRNGR